MFVTNSSNSRSPSIHKAHTIKHFPKCLLNILKKIFNFITCSSKKLSKVSQIHSSCKTVKKTQKQAALTVSKAIRKDKIKKGCTNQKLDYLTQELIKGKDGIVWTKLKDIGHLDVQGKTVILQTLEIKTAEALKINQVNAAKFLRQIAGEKPKKIFIPFAVKYPAPHAMLIVVELNTKDDDAAKITLINSLGESSAYRPALTGFAEELQKLFPSEETTIVHNKVRQQSDGLTCGFHVLENMLLLAEQDNVQAFVAIGKLPERSKSDISNRLQGHIKKIDDHSIKV